MDCAHINFLFHWTTSHTCILLKIFSLVQKIKTSFRIPHICFEPIKQIKSFNLERFYAVQFPNINISGPFCLLHAAVSCIRTTKKKKMHIQNQITYLFESALWFRRPPSVSSAQSVLSTATVFAALGVKQSSIYFAR